MKKRTLLYILGFIVLMSITIPIITGWLELSQGFIKITETYKVTYGIIMPILLILSFFIKDTNNENFDILEAPIVFGLMFINIIINLFNLPFIVNPIFIDSGIIIFQIFGIAIINAIIQTNIIKFIYIRSLKSYISLS